MMENNIEVVARIRPPIQSDRFGGEDVCLFADAHAKEVILANRMSFYVDHALPLEISQSQLFDGVISQKIDYMLQGYDVSFIAFGHINSGKTYTMLGPGLHCTSSETTYGIVPRSGRQIFNKLLAFRQRFGVQFKVLVTFFEIFNEEATDLLASYSDNTYANVNVSFKTNERGVTTIQGVREIECRTASELFNCLRVGMNYRKTLRTNLNSLSSLSHCITVIKVEQKWFSNEGKLETIVSQAMFVDLAGSEKMFLTSPIDSNNTYVGNIGLGVISAIVTSFSGQWLPSSPFTQSLLFPLLKDSFIGSIKTLLICCLSPSSSDYSETLNSLRLIDHIHTLNKYSLLRNTNGINNDIYQTVDDINDIEGFNKNSSGLEFAAGQWLKLVSNAEDLFNKLVDSNMSVDAREKIEEWLCLKQECEDCFSAETRTVINNNNNQNCTGVRSLEIIEEVTETDTKSKSDKSNDTSDSSSDSDSDCDCNTDVDEKLDMHNDDSDNIGASRGDVSDSDNNNCTAEKESTFHQEYNKTNLYKNDFIEKLDHFMKRFVLCTDKKVDDIINLSVPNKQCDAIDIAVPKHSRCNNSRRKSILPCENLILLKDMLSEQKMDSKDSADELVSKDGNDEKYEGRIRDYVNVNNSHSPEHDSKTDLLNEKQLTETLRPEKKLDPFAVNNIKQIQSGLTNLDLEAASKRINKLQSMIEMKEQFIEDIIRNSDTRISAKAKFQRKRTRLEEEHSKAKLELAKAEVALTKKLGDAALINQVQKCKNLMNRYEKRLHDIDMIKQIAGDSAKKVSELENSLYSSKRKIQKLKKQLKKEEELKYSLENENESIEDEKRIKQIDVRCKTQSDTLKCKILNADEIENSQVDCAVADDSLNSLSNKSLSPSRGKQALERQKPLSLENPSNNKNMNQNLLYVSARISNLEQKLKEISSDFEQDNELDTKESLRHEIRNLRKTRECLLEEKKYLDSKLIKDKVLTAIEERKLIECDEAIEAIDATIEYKNELICGRKGLISIIENGHHAKSEEMLLLRLMKLSTMEMQILLYKYFQKVVDLRESGRKMETQISGLDRRVETQAWKIQALSNALQQAHLESERRLIIAQKEHQEKLHLIFRHFADETSGHSSGADDTEKFRRQNKALKQRVSELEGMLFKATSSDHSKNMIRVAGASGSNGPGPELRPPSPTSQLNIPHHNLRQLGGALAQHTTLVTRQKNKLIIQQQKTSKKKLSK